MARVRNWRRESSIWRDVIRCNSLSGGDSAIVLVGGEERGELVYRQSICFTFTATEWFVVEIFFLVLPGDSCLRNNLFLQIYCGFVLW